MKKFKVTYIEKPVYEIAADSPEDVEETLREMSIDEMDDATIDFESGIHEITEVPATPEEEEN